MPSSNTTCPYLEMVSCMTITKDVFVSLHMVIYPSRCPVCSRGAAHQRGAVLRRSCVRRRCRWHVLGGIPWAAGGDVWRNLAIRELAAECRARSSAGSCDWASFRMYRDNVPKVRFGRTTKRSPRHRRHDQQNQIQLIPCHDQARVDLYPDGTNKIIKDSDSRSYWPEILLRYTPEGTAICQGSLGGL